MKKIKWLVPLLLVVLALSLIIGINLGYSKIKTEDILSILANKIGFNTDIDHIRSASVDIIMLVRLPRLILAMVVGMSLSVAGVSMQAIVKNPIADPYILGISSGASFGATVGVVLGLGTKFGSGFVGVTAFFGALIFAFLVLFLSNIGSKSNSAKLLLSGMAISTVAGTFSNLMIYLSSNRDAARQVSFWLLGSVAGAKWEDIKLIVPIILLCTIFFFTQYRTLDLMLLGDEIAITLGKDMNRSRQIYIVIVSVMVGFVVYVSGVIGFVGLIVPHICRFLIGTNHKSLIPLSALIGSIILVWADIMARNLISGSELPTGVVVSLVGAPLFVYLIISKAYKGD